jgi:hypothetical protein
MPYWYWVVAVDAAGNTSTQSTGEGAVTYATGTSYRVQHAGQTVCAVANANADNSALVTQPCATATSALRQWNFTVNSGDSVFIRFASGTARAWYVSDNTNGRNVTMSTTANASHSRSQWTLGASWNGSAAAVEIRRTSSATLCLEVSGGASGNGVALQQVTCSATSAAQRFALIQP